MAAGRIIIPNVMPALDINGNPVAGAKLTFYVNETTTLLPVYTSAALSVAHPNPISADAAGAFASIFADTDVAYSVAITDADGAPIVGLRNRDNVKASLFFGDDATTRADLTLSNLSNTATARTNLGVAIGTNVQAYDADLTTWAGITPGTGVGTFLATPSSSNLKTAVTDETGSGALVFADAPTLSTIELGHASDTTLARSSAGNMTIEGNLVYRAGGTDVPVADGGTGSSTAADARTALAVVGTADLAASTGAALVGSIQTGTGATARTAQAKLRDIVSVKDFGATGDGVTNDRVAIQAAIDAVSTAGGGTILFPNGKYVLGTTGLTVANNIILQGDSTRYAGSTTRGTSLVYTGTGSAVYGQNVLDLQINDLDLDCTGTTGTTVRGVNLSGVWKTTLRNVTVRGVTRAKGYGILFDTVGVSGPFGAQHNYLEQVECSDGVIRFLGVDANDGVTTTVCNTIRGMQYQIVSSQVVFINSTAEGWATGAGFDFSGAGCYGLLLGCDIEGAGTPGILIDGSAEVREVGTIWAGFSGTNKVTGDTASLRSYGGKLEFLATLVADTPKLTSTAGNINLPSYVSEYLVPPNVTGGTQEGYRQWRRYVAGAEVVDHDWDQHSVVKKTITVATTSPTTLMTVPIAGGDGFVIEVVARGFQVGDGWFCVTRRAVVINNGAVVITQAAQETAGIANQISFDASGDNVRVRWVATTANSTTVYLTTRILGDYAGFS